MPSTWTHTYYGGSEVLEELTVEDVQWEIDAAVRPGEIPVEFPPATHVCKEHSTEHWLVGKMGSGECWRQMLFLARSDGDIVNGLSNVIAVGESSTPGCHLPEIGWTPALTTR